MSEIEDKYISLLTDFGFKRIFLFSSCVTQIASDPIFDQSV